LKRVLCKVLGLSLLISVAGLASAQQLPIRQTQNDLNRTAQPREIRNAPNANARITESQASNLASQRFAGKVLRITLVGEGDAQRYQIRMENEGKVFTVYVNVTTGRVSGGG